eukprot:XP_001708212.1 Hypothetical protein GL50803_34745 [Giardia lamblia ATCC 50803]
MNKHQNEPNACAARKLCIWGDQIVISPHIFIDIELS